MLSTIVPIRQPGAATLTCYCSKGCDSGTRGNECFHHYNQPTTCFVSCDSAAEINVFRPDHLMKMVPSRHGKTEEEVDLYLSASPNMVIPHVTGTFFGFVAASHFSSKPVFGAHLVISGIVVDARHK